MTTERVRTLHCQALVSRVAELRVNDKFCDIDVIVDEEVFKCHRVVLGAASEYFEKMFSGTFNESSTMKITLLGIEANIFEEILKFVYTGYAEVRNSNVYDMICAADFYNLPFVFDLCTEFVKENLNALAEDILAIFSAAHRIGLIQLVELLSKHIHQNFDYFIRRLEFFKLTVDGLMEVLNQIERAEQPIARDLFLDGIYVWITHQEDLTLENRKSYLNRLLKKIDFLSADYTRFMTEMVSGQSVDGDGDVSLTVQRPIKLSHVYVSRNGEDDSSIGVSIFTLYADGGNSSPEFKWVYSGELGCPVDYMKNVSIGDRLYSLRHLGMVKGDSEQLFCGGSSISMYPSLTLKPPPSFMFDYNMCVARDNIYVHTNWQMLKVPEYSSEFSREELLRGMYVYKPEVDRWFPVPCPKTMFTQACMTCDEDGVLYLIGGENSNRSVVQAYDSRVQRWFSLPNTIGDYFEAACCASGKKIYVAGGSDPNLFNGRHRPTTVEMYDSVSGNWQLLKDLGEERIFDHLLVNWYPKMGYPSKIFSFHQWVDSNTRILCLNPVLNDGWYSMPSLFDAASDKNLTFDHLWILDMVIF